jgi:hypothetical protein
MSSVNFVKHLRQQRHCIVLVWHVILYRLAPRQLRKLLYKNYERVGY